MRSIHWNMVLNSEAILINYAFPLFNLERMNLPRAFEIHNLWNWEHQQCFSPNYDENVFNKNSYFNHERGEYLDVMFMAITAQHFYSINEIKHMGATHHELDDFILAFMSIWSIYSTLSLTLTLTIIEEVWKVKKKFWIQWNRACNFVIWFFDSVPLLFYQRTSKERILIVDVYWLYFLVVFYLIHLEVGKKYDIWSTGSLRE